METISPNPFYKLNSAPLVMVGEKTCALEGYFYWVEKELYRKGLFGIDTEKGHFFPASISLVAMGLEELIEQGYISNSSFFLDAGSGDGRIVALASYEYGFKAFGVEHDKYLASYSRKKLKEAPFDFNSYKIIQGDFLSDDTYKKAGLDFTDFNIICNYENNAFSLLEKISRVDGQMKLLLIRRTLDNSFGDLQLKYSVNLRDYIQGTPAHPAAKEMCQYNMKMGLYEK